MFQPASNPVPDAVVVTRVDLESIRSAVGDARMWIALGSSRAADDALRSVLLRLTVLAGAE